MEFCADGFCAVRLIGQVPWGNVFQTKSMVHLEGWVAWQSELLLPWGSSAASQGHHGMSRQSQKQYFDSVCSTCSKRSLFVYNTVALCVLYWGILWFKINSLTVFFPVGISMGGPMGISAQASELQELVAAFANSYAAVLSTNCFHQRRCNTTWKALVSLVMCGANIKKSLTWVWCAFH